MTTTTKAPRLSKSESQALYAKADAAGKAAAEAKVPTPMVVAERANPLDDSSPIVRQYAPIEGGICGTAYVTLRPARGRFAMLLKERGAFNGYYGGLQLAVRGYGQSYERSAAYAAAFAAVLREAGLNAGTDSWIN